MNYRKYLGVLLGLMGSAGAQADGAYPTASNQGFTLPGLSDRLSLSFEERLRGEWRDNQFDFNDQSDALTDDTWLLSRTRLGVRLTATPWLRFAAEGQDLRESFSDRPDVIGALGAEGDDDFDLRQGYVEIGDPARLSLTLGRQELNYGDGRLVSRAPWKNSGQSFDAARVHYQGSHWWLDGFVSSVVRFRDGHFNQSDWLADDTRNETFSGLYLSGNWLAFQVTDFYLFELHADTPGGSDFVTLGGRVKGDPARLAGWDYVSELAFQTGTRSGKDLRAFAGHWGAGYNWLRHPWKPRLGIDYSYASGDANPADGHINTFQNLFPTNHVFYGYMDEFAWQNIHNPALHLALEPSASVKLALDQRFYWLADTGDAWYRGSLATVRPITPGAQGYVGSEFDATAYWKALRHLDLQVGYSHFFAGGYVGDTGAEDDADFAYVMATLHY